MLSNSVHIIVLLMLKFNWLIHNPTIGKHAQDYPRLILIGP